MWKNVDNLYKEAYPNHPMTKWVGLNRGNFKWTLGKCGIYSGRILQTIYNKHHKSSKIIKIIYFSK